MRNQSYTSDELLKMDDESLRDLFFQMRSKIYTMKREKKNTKDLEIYFCYISKEIEDRSGK